MSIRDAHLHLAEHGRELAWLQLGACTSRDQCLEELARHAATHPHDAWIVASGLRVEGWNDPTSPDARDLHHAAGGRYVILNSFDHHAMIVSTAVLDAAAIDNDTPDPPDGIIVRRDGRPTGLLLEAACNLIRTVLPKPTNGQRRAWILNAQRDLARHHITEVHEMHGDADLARILLALQDEGALDLDVLIFVPPGHFHEARNAFSGRRTGRVRLGGIKLFTDGTLNSRTAAMLEPFADPLPSHPRGTPLLTDAEINDAFSQATRAGLAVAAHAIGDAAVHRLLDLHERFANPALRLRIEHAQFIDEADIPRFPRQNVIASIQPCHLLTDIEAIRRFTPHRARRAFPMRDLADACTHAGIDTADIILLGSDAPIVPPDPADNIQAAVHRRRASMPRSDAVAPEQAIPENLTRRLMTI